MSCARWRPVTPPRAELLAGWEALDRNIREARELGPGVVLDVTAADRAQAARLVAEAADGSPGAALWPAVRAFAADPEDEAARAALAAALVGGPDGDDLPGRHPLDGAAPFVVLADAAELLDDPPLLHAYAAAMTGAAGVTLAIDATALRPDAAAERLGALVADAGVGDDLDLLAVTGALDEIGRARLAAGVRAILGDRPGRAGPAPLRRGDHGRAAGPRRRLTLRRRRRPPGAAPARRTQSRTPAGPGGRARRRPRARAGTACRGRRGGRAARACGRRRARRGR